MLRFALERAAFAALIVLVLAAVGCGSDEDSGNAIAGRTLTASPTREPTPAPPDSEEAKTRFEAFVEAVQAGDLEGAWSLYAASVPGSQTQHRADLGCDHTVFGNEFPRIRNLFSRAAPFEAVQTYGAIPGSSVVEIELESAEGSRFLATLIRVKAYETYRLQFLNSGETASPGVPALPPPPDDPQGYCGIWSGPR